MIQINFNTISTTCGVDSHWTSPRSDQSKFGPFSPTNKTPHSQSGQTAAPTHWALLPVEGVSKLKRSGVGLYWIRAGQISLSCFTYTHTHTPFTLYCPLRGHDSSSLWSNCSTARRRFSSVSEKNASFILVLIYRNKSVNSRSASWCGVGVVGGTVHEENLVSLIWICI